MQTDILPHTRPGDLPATVARRPSEVRLLRSGRYPGGLLAGQRDRFGGLLLALTLLLCASLLAAGVLTGPLAWAVGLVYICYDTWLLGSMVRMSRRAVRAEAERAAAPAGPLPGVTVLIAARNEEAALPMALDALLAQGEPPERVIVIDDGSSDGTLDVLARRYGVRFDADGPLGRSTELPFLKVLHRPAGGGKARALNAALPLCRTELVVTLDADTILEPGAIAAVRRAFAADRELAAGCGVLRPLAGTGWARPLFQLYQTYEYLRSFLWRVAWGHEQTLILVSGAFAIFRREALAAVGGFDPSSRVEDYELMFRMHRRSLEQRGRGLAVRVIPDARATTDVPASPRVFLRQRTRWFAGFIETMFRNRDMVGSKRHGRLGTYHLLVKTVDTMLPIFGLSAFLSLVLLLVLGRALSPIVLGALAAKFCFDFGCHVYALYLHEHWQTRRVSGRLFARAALATLTEPYFFQLFRQIGALLGWVAFLRGNIEWKPQR